MGFPGKYRRLSARVFFVVILIATAWFFYEELKVNWESLHLSEQHFFAAGILAGLGMVILSYLCATMAWFIGINAYPTGSKPGFGESVAVVNMAQMTKYLPGKVWSYALQMLLMEGRGVPKSYIVYVNLLVTLSLLATSLLAGLLYLMLYTTLIPFPLSVLMFCASAAAYAGLVFFSGKMLKGVIGMANRIFRTEIILFDLPPRVLLRMQGPLLAANTLFGLSSCAVCYGIGWAVPPAMLFPVSAAALFSDLIGFVVLLAPGGLGIREGAMFLLLKGVTDMRVTLLLPLAMRGVTMLSDLILGILALVMFRKYFSNKK